MGIVFVSVSNYFRVLQPRVIREALDHVIEQVNVIHSNPAMQSVIMEELGKSLLYFGGLVMGYALMMGIFMYFMRQTIVVMSRLIEYDMRKEIFKQYEALPQSFYKKNNTGDLMARITEDVSKVRMYLGPGVLYTINLISIFVLVIASMINVSPRLTLYTLIPLPLLSLCIYFVSSVINRKSEIIQKQIARLNSISQEVYSGIRVVKAYSKEKAMSHFFSNESEDYKMKSLALARTDAMFHPTMILMVGTSTLLTIYIGGIQMMNGTITPGNIAEFVIYVNMLTWPVTAIGWIASIVQRASASQKRINEFLSIRPEIENKKTSSDALKGKITFDNVTFVYPDSGIKALDGVTFEMNPGEKLAIFGKTGGGKTTIADLMVRSYDVAEGQIRIDGLPIVEHDLQNLRKRIGYVPQDVFLFSDTVEKNIAFGNDTGDVSVLERYSKYAAVHDEILTLNEGYKTMIGERGVTLSGGQKQRISLARALMKEPDVLILDDCLSAVDSDTEHRILEYFQSALKDKSAIVITHRIYQSLHFDQILVLDNGKIIERGDHETLLKRGGYYNKLFLRQQLADNQIKK